jgi:hypothetical protein
LRYAAGGLLLALAGTAVAGGDSAPDQALKKFHADYKQASTDDQRVAAVASLAEYRHERVARTLAACLTRVPVTVRIMAARRLGAFEGVDGVGDLLVAALGDRQNLQDKARGVRVEILRSLGTLRAAEAAGVVDRLVSDSDVWVAKAAVDAAGKIRAKTSVEPLIKALLRIEGRQGEKEVMLDLYEGQLPNLSLGGIVKNEAEKQDQPKTQRQLLKDPLLSALVSITRLNHASGADWQTWWQSQKAKFVVPPN